MLAEGQHMDRKSLRSLEDTSELAKDCVAFANARGGILLIGIEDGEADPPTGQVVSDENLALLQKRIPQLTVNVEIEARRVQRAEGEYIELEVYSSRSIAATSDGRYYIRVGDESRPVMPNELARLFGEKSAFAWESHRPTHIPVDRVDDDKCRTVMERLRDSDRVSSFVKDKTDAEILDYYLFSQEGCLTNLGVLWFGRREDRAVMRYAPCVQCIKYDEAERKTNKWVWDDFSLNPWELIEAVWREVPEWRESYEIPDGLFRTTVPHYDEIVVRELLANALVHRPYTQSGDIFIDLFPDRMEIHNPGLLPLGVTPRNILHMTVKRNELLSKVFYDLGLMEREGSGYDRMYEVLLSTGRPVPEVREGDDRVAVTVYKRIADKSVLDFIGRADQRFEMSQKEKITLGILAQHESLTAIELCRVLEIAGADDLRNWLGRLTQWEIVKTRGRTKGTQYAINPEVLRRLEFKGATSLKGIEEHRLRELIVSDLSIYREASIKEIQQRIGVEIPRHKIRHQLEVLIMEGRVGREGVRRWTRYIWKDDAS